MTLLKRHSKKFLFLCTSLLSFPTFANTAYTQLNHPHIVLQAGGFNATQGKAQHIGIQGLIGDHFSVTQRNDQNYLVGLGAFMDGPEWADWRFMFGLNAFYLANTTVKGKVTQENLFTNLGYHYSINNYPLYVEAKALRKIFCNQADLTFNLGIGSNFIQAYRFKEYSLDGGITIPDHIFSSHTTAAFSATAGIGVQINNVIRCMPLEIGYRFFYLGQGHFNKTSDQVLNTLKTGQSYANALVASFSF